MDMTSYELKTITRLRKHLIDWRVNRWLLLIHGIFTLFIYMLFLSKLTQVLETLGIFTGGKYSEASFVFSALMTGVSLYVFFGIYQIVSTLKNWNGNWNVILTLKMYDELSKKC